MNPGRPTGPQFDISATFEREYRKQNLQPGCNILVVDSTRHVLRIFIDHGVILLCVPLRDVSRSVRIQHGKLTSPPIANRRIRTISPYSTILNN
jgi:hypothetical protein